ncbi:hypothetical protein LTS18_011764 [Coniosporium uncinatum]|uniref:Uncharacterized protein n=1 Tax=Coniosporium uncinatum TaxID=93489 RepID=A0ACC3DJS7_9PEZI|nr:hypothetical protein LTS18_011764 [Coniosporium uncinatum]
MAEDILRVSKGSPASRVKLHTNAVVGMADKFASFHDRTVEIHVGPDHRVFSVHEKLICASSDFFKDGMSRDWKESRERTFTFEYDEPEIFDIYACWLYYQKFPTRLDRGGLEGNKEYVQLAKAYVLGEKLQDRDFQDAVIDAVVDKSNHLTEGNKTWSPVGDAVKIIYDGTPDTSPAQKLLVDIHCHYGHTLWLTDHCPPNKDIPHDFLLDLARKMFDERPKPNCMAEEKPKGKAASCRYHNHGSYQACFKKR